MRHLKNDTLHELLLWRDRVEDDEMDQYVLHFLFSLDEGSGFGMTLQFEGAKDDI